MLHYDHFQKAGGIACAAGALFGQFFEYRCFVNTGAMNISAWTWYQAAPVKIVLRFLVTLVIVLLCLFPITLESVASVNMGAGFESLADDDQLFLSALLRSIYHVILPYFLSSFVVFGLLRYMFHKMKLDNPDAARKEF